MHFYTLLLTNFNQKIIIMSDLLNRTLTETATLEVIDRGPGALFTITIQSDAKSKDDINFNWTELAPNALLCNVSVDSKNRQSTINWFTFSKLPQTLPISFPPLLPIACSLEVVNQISTSKTTPFKGVVKSGGIGDPE